MARILIHNAWYGCRVLVEYLGNPSTPVVMELYTVVGAVATLIASRSTVTDVNGFAHWVYDASALPAGTELRADGIAV